MTARDVIASVEEYHAVSGPERLGDLMAEKIISKLSAAGYSIVHESEIHGATKAKCIAAVEAEQLVEHTGEPDDLVYRLAIRDALRALRALPDGGVDNG